MEKETDIGALKKALIFVGKYRKIERGRNDEREYKTFSVKSLVI